MPKIGPDFSTATEIIPERLWLGGIRAAMDEQFLANNKIDVIFNCTKDIPFIQGPTCLYRVPIDDNLEDGEIQNLLKWSPEIVFKLLREYQNGKNILVHCAAGMQRSAAVTQMLLMTLWKQPKEPVYAFLKERRPIVFHPSMNFAPAVLWYENWLFTNILKKKDIHQ